MAEDQSPGIREVFRRARERAGLKQEEVAAAVSGLTQSTYSRFELGQADLDVSDIFKIKEFLDKQEYKKAGAISLRSLMQSGIAAQSGSGKVAEGKLTEVVAKELRDEYHLKEAREWDRLMEEELPALRTENARLKRLLERDTELIRSLSAENVELKKLTKPFKKPRTPPRSKRK